MNLPKAAQIAASAISSTTKDTSFMPSKGEKGCTVLSTAPIILFCDLSLAPGESKAFTYKEKIPLEAPPSYRGTAIKYVYKVTIGAQQFDHPTRLLRVPFRVLVVPGLNDISVYNSNDNIQPSNPFQVHSQKKTSVLDVALEVLQTITCRKGPNYYNITNQRGKVAKFCLFKQAYRIGDDIVGMCDFSLGTIPCVQFSVTLQSEEQISEECKKKTSQNSTVTSYSKHLEFCLHTQRTHISIPIPLAATPAFKTDLVNLRWRLHFEFVTAKSPLPAMEVPESPEIGASWQGEAQLDVETMVWDLPIKVFATNPMSASSVSLLRRETSAVL